MKFHLALRTVARLARRRGKISSEQFDALTTAVPVLADGPDSAAGDLAQTAFEIGVNDGTFDGATPLGKINWANFFAFLEKILPIILQLISVKSTA
jgi:hypothetical protein